MSADSLPGMLTARPTLSRRIAELHRPRLADRAADWPADPRMRVLLQIALSLPFLVAALLSVRFAAPTPNDELVRRAARIVWNRADPSWVGHLYPPITMVLGAIAPGGAVGLALIGAFAAGVLVHRVIEAMRRRGFATSTVVIATLALAANPLFAYAATQSLPAFVGIGCFGLGFADLVRFTTDRDTQSGFRAGILLMFAALSDPSGLVYVVVAALAAPLLSAGTSRNGRWFANTLVVLFPTLSAFGSVMLLDWVFAGDPLGVVHDLVRFDASRLPIFSTLFTTPLGWLWLASMGAVWAIALIANRPAAVILTLLLFAAILGGYVLDLIAQNAAGTIYLMMVLAAVGIVPPASRGRLAFAINLLLLLELGVAWTTAFNRPVVLDWMLVVTRPFLGG